MTTPGAGPLRQRIEHRSAVLVVYLAGRRRALVAAAPLALLVALVLASGPLALLPGAALVAFVSWLAYLSWPHLHPVPRALRLVGLLAVLAITAVQTGR